VKDFTHVRNRTPEQFLSADKNARRWPDKFLRRQKFRRGRFLLASHRQAALSLRVEAGQGHKNKRVLIPQGKPWALWAHEASIVGK
jgi:hypothetical protein